MLRRLALAGATAVALSACFVPGPTSKLARSADPVVITGSQVPALVGSPPGDIVAFRNTPTAGWQQIPVQVDERAVVNFGTTYHGAANSVNVLTYTDPGTWAGADPNPMLDADDEIAFMARDAGGRPAAFSEPAGVVHGSGQQLRVIDLTDNSVGAVYLFRRSGTLDPGAGKHYVQYDFSLASGDYRTTYQFADGPNPENSRVTTPYYSHHFGDRWQSDELEITAPGSSGVDILDRHKNLFAPSTCGRSEDTFDDAEGAFVVNKVGPVRAIRSYIGANSGPNTQRTHIFYDRREDITTDLRVHAIPSVMDFFDYSPAAIGMKYSNSVNPAGVTIDGVPDALTGGLPSWELVDGPQGSMAITTVLRTSYSPVTTASYYLDDRGPDDDSVHRRRVRLRRERELGDQRDPVHRSGPGLRRHADDDARPLVRLARSHGRRRGTGPRVHRPAARGPRRPLDRLRNAMREGARGALPHPSVRARRGSGLRVTLPAERPERGVRRRMIRVRIHDELQPLERGGAAVHDDPVEVGDVVPGMHEGHGRARAGVLGHARCHRRRAGCPSGTRVSRR